jgi:aprataxin
MHVISQDLNSPSLKSAKHWNSFSGSFFIDASLFIKALESKGSVSVDWDGAEDTLAAKPICPICNAVFGSGPKQIKELQTHYQSCYSGLVMQKPDELIVTHPAASL